MNGTYVCRAGHFAKTYLELDPSVRKMLIEHFKSHLLDQLADETEKEPTTEELEAEYKKVALVLRGKRLHLLRVS